MKRIIKNRVKKGVILGVAVSISSLMGCFNTIEKTKAVIDYPPLTLEDNFTALQENSKEAELDKAMAKQMLADALFRFTNIVDIANQSTGLVAEADLNAKIKFKSALAFSAQSVSKPTPRDLYTVEASNEFCGDESENEALIWDDRDNSITASEGDVWFYRVVNCQLTINSAYVTGLISQTGMYQLFLNENTDTSTDANDTETNTFKPYENYLYTLDIQIDPQDGKMAYFQNTAINYAKPEEEITTAEIKANSLLGVAKTSIDEAGVEIVDNYLFDIENAKIQNNDDEQTLKISLTATYYDSVMGTFVKIATPELLVFNYEYKAPGVEREDNNPYDMITLVSGEIQIESGEITASLSVDETDDNKVIFVYNNDQASAESYEQSTYFNTALEGFNTDRTFSLVNMSR